MMLAMLAYITLGLAVVLVCRQPARHLFGAGPAFTLWLLPPMLATLPWLPTLPSAWSITPTLLVLPAAQAWSEQATPPTSTWHWPLLFWLAGSTACLLRLAIHYARLLRQSRHLPPSMLRVLQMNSGQLDSRRWRLHPAGPAVLWAPLSLVLLPVDFLERFDADEQRLVLQHEYAHLRRGDALWSLLAELALALLWFHPLAWLALSRLRLDQELACDECVLRQSPQDATKYAYTLLHSTGMNPTPAIIPWLAQPQLKERLNMIQRHRPGTLRRRIGFLGLAALMAASTLVAQAAVHTQANQLASQDLSANSRTPPHYPEDAIKNKQEGMVVLMVLVGTDGNARNVRVDPATHAAPSLIKAASDVAMEWHFNPAIKNGKPIEGYARVPVKFSLDPLPPAAPATPLALISSKS